MVIALPPCNHTFTHIKINGDAVQKAFRDSYGTDPRPDLGETHLRCPHCRMESLYARFQLICEDAPGESAKMKGA
jgi:hypothetical protein